MNSRGDLHFGESGAIGNREVGNHLALRAGDELGALATDHIELGRRLDVGDQLEKIRVERSAKALVCSDRAEYRGS